MNWTRLLYGTAVIAAISGGTAIYWTTRPHVKPIDIIELAEAAHERLMPFAYDLATNVVIYQQPIWTVDPSTNRWQLASNTYPYLVFGGFQSVTDSVVNLNGIVTPGSSTVYFAGEEIDGQWYFYGSTGSVPQAVDISQSGVDWQYDVITTGRTLNVQGIDTNGLPVTNELPAIVLDVHPDSVGASIEKSTLTHIDAIINSVITKYVDHEAYGGLYTNGSIPMLTKSSVWARLSLPSIWTNISQVETNVEYVWSYTNGTSVTNLTGWNMAWVSTTNITTNLAFTTSDRITTNMLFERYRVLSYLRWTKALTFGWTNATRTTWTEPYLSTNVTVTTNAGILVSNPHPEEGEVLGYMGPDLPIWWDWTVTNGPPGDWFDPDVSDTIDDVVSGSACLTNLATAPPSRIFTSAGRESKSQAYGPSLIASYQYVTGQETLRTNVMTLTEAYPRVRLPLNIGSNAITGDVYCDATTLSTSLLTRVFSGEVSRPHPTNQWWIGSSAINAATNIMDATNFPYAFTQTISRTTFWTDDPSGTYIDAISSTWGCSWSISAQQVMIMRDVVLKWQFSRCPAH